jgi:hypothetical protein
VSSSLQPRNLAQLYAAQHSVHLTGGSLRVFRRFARLEVVSDKMVLSRPTHQQVTQTVRLINTKLLSVYGIYFMKRH